MEVRPFQLLLMALYIVVIFFFVSLILPQEITLAPNQVLRIPQIIDLFPSFAPSKYADISEIREQYENKEAKDTPEIIDIPSHLRIQYPKNQDTVLYNFFRGLEQIPEKESLIRVLHYGDSQLEGDRITAGFRKRLQTVFGGCGTGFLPIGKNLPSNDYQLNINLSWKDYAIWGGGYRHRNPRNYGVLGRYALFQKKANIQVTLNSYATRTARNAEVLKIFYGNIKRSFQVEVEFDNQSTQDFAYLLEKDFDLVTFNMPQDWQSWKMNMNAEENFEIYGIAMDCPSGIAVDNIAFRGSSGTEFKRFSKKVLSSQIQFLNVKLIIVQFGVNIVPYVRKDYRYFEEQFYKQLVFLKENTPNIPILVVGVSDMAKKENGEFLSYPNIELIRDAQRRAAFKSGCAFWDLFEAMGGENSIPSWVRASPALASPDYTHFTPQGADIVAEMLYEAIMYEYQKFRKIPFETKK